MDSIIANVCAPTEIFSIEKQMRKVTQAGLSRAIEQYY